MITIADITYSSIHDENGLALVLVIDGQCLYDFPATVYGVELFTQNKGIEDVSSEYPDYDGITVKIIKEEGFEILQVAEYIGSILLSDHQVVDLNLYPGGEYVFSPNATFDGEKFIITN
jgi:hypothetical protein